jgi:hypothetical protein
MRVLRKRESFGSHPSSLDKLGMRRLRMRILLNERVLMLSLSKHEPVYA